MFKLYPQFLENKTSEIKSFLFEYKLNHTIIQTIQEIFDVHILF